MCVYYGAGSVLVLGFAVRPGYEACLQLDVFTRWKKNSIRRHRNCLKCGWWCLYVAGVCHSDRTDSYSSVEAKLTACRVCDLVTSSNRGSYQHELQSAAGSHRSLRGGRPNVLCLNPRVLARCISCRHCVTRRTNRVKRGSKGRTVGS